MSEPCKPTYDWGMRPIRALLAMFAISALVWAPAAVAKQYAPPGKAGTSEYAEDIPTSGGNVSTPAMGGGNKTAAEIDRLGAGKSGVSKLAKLGKAGAEAAQFALQTAPTTLAASTRASKTGASGLTQTSTSGRTPTRTPSGTSAPTPQTTLTASAGTAIGGIAHLIGGSDGGGIGILLPLVLLFSLIGAGAFGVLRLRRSGAPQP